jgi:hypothetical protein
LGQGRDNVKKLFKENPALAQEIEAQIREWAKTIGRPASKPVQPVTVITEEAPTAPKVNLDISVD